jgi:hypothetical protein
MQKYKKRSLLAFLLQPLKFRLLPVIATEGTLLQVFVFGFPLSGFGLRLHQLLLQGWDSPLQISKALVLLPAIARTGSMHAFLDASFCDKSAL